MSTNPSPVHVRLREVTPDDLPVLFSHQIDPEASRMAVVHPRDAAAFSVHWDKILRDPKVIARAILADGILVGSINCFKMDGQDMVGYWISREHWGRGIATQALRLLLAEIPIRPLHARAARSNVASIRVLQRCSFTLTGYQVSPADERYPECEEALLLLT